MARRGKADLRDLIADGVLFEGASVVGRARSRDYEARITASGDVEVVRGPKIQGSLSKTATRISGYESNGWKFWKVVRDGRRIPLDELR